MKKLIVLIACLGLILFAGTAGALMIDFENYPDELITAAGNSGVVNPDQYAGFGLTFNGFGLMSEARFQNTTYLDSGITWYASENSFPSGDFAVFNNNGLSVSIEVIEGWSPFDVETISFAALGLGTQAVDGTPGTLTIEGYTEETVYTKTLTTGEDLLVNSFTEIIFGWENITMLTFETDKVSWFLMDNFNDQAPEPNNQIPEPSILLLLGAGLLGIGFARRKFNK